MDRTAACNRAHPQPPRRTRNRRNDRPPHRQQAPAGEHQAGHYRAHRWHSLVRRRNNEGGVGGGERGRCRAHDCGSSFSVSGGASELTRIADGAARSARPCQGGRTNRGGNRLLLFSVLYGFWVANYVAFNGGVMRELAAEFLAHAEKQGATEPLIVGHRLVGTSLACTGDIAQGRAHHDRAVALYKTTEHRPLALRFGQDVRVAILSYRAMALWMLGYPKAALADTEQALADAREIDQATTLMYAFFHAA